MLTKEKLTDAHEQGLSISTRNGNIKIVAILNDVYGVNHCDSNIVQWWMFEKFERNEAKIEQPKLKIDLSILKEGDIYYLKSDKSSYLIKFLYSQLKDIEIIWDCNYALRNNCIYREINGIKGSFITELRLPTESELELFYSKFPNLKPKPKYNGRAVKCDTVEQANYIATNRKFTYNFNEEDLDQFIYINLNIDEWDGGDYYNENNYEIISFSDYCKENGITEPKWIQGFEIGKAYNDVVMVSDDNINWYIEKLVAIKKHTERGWQFETQLTFYKYCRYPKRNEINEIKFVD